MPGLFRHGILNLNNADLFSHELLQWYSIQLATAAMPFYSCWRTVVNSYVARGILHASPVERLSFFMNKRAEFQEAWLNYIALQDLDYSAAFRCCCEDEQCMYVIADGILLGLQKEKLAEQKNAKLAMLKSHCAFMTQPMFLVYVRYFMFMNCMLKK
ncbi:hypothetical protein GPECTOR_393g212 [Gonium pectorale]|uniref:HMG domain-containing protein n=1 Tax=Gonium pectorale TaxID=33097 RepID=A0A150FVB3_GONPE|nr:hypothetical protein GPECTOR_393g212 [Gonium pectorale]|eukprot:KXZ41561.1 hypothetical protein GPECTOR_393g212 [Gonium pectorale]